MIECPSCKLVIQCPSCDDFICSNCGFDFEPDRPSPEETEKILKDVRLPITEEPTI